MAVPRNHKLAPPEVDYILQHSKAGAAIIVKAVQNLQQGDLVFLLQAAQQFVGNVKVGVDVLDIIMLIQDVHQLQDPLRGCGIVDGNGGLGNHGRGPHGCA